METLNVQVENFRSSNGNDVPNQFKVYTDNGAYFQSYSSVIAFRDNKDKVYLDSNKWDYSTTTGKYRNQFLGESISETRKKIDSGEYELTDLNR